jgi:hypothetical protein
MRQGGHCVQKIADAARERAFIENSSAAVLDSGETHCSFASMVFSDALL